jgi:hypothetical protein
LHNLPYTLKSSTDPMGFNLMLLAVEFKVPAPNTVQVDITYALAY